MYLSYEQYQNMGGTLEETAFNNFEYEAETIVNWYTFNRLKGEETYPEELARCMYRIIDLIQLKAEALALGAKTVTITTGDSGSGSPVTQTITTSPYISGQSNDGVSIDYNTVNASDLLGLLGLDKRSNLFEEIVFRYLQGVRNSKNKRLTYRGLYPDE